MTWLQVMVEHVIYNYNLNIRKGKVQGSLDVFTAFLSVISNQPLGLPIASHKLWGKFSGSLHNEGYQ